MAEEKSELRVRAQNLFAVCDKEEKGFVTKRDMQVLYHYPYNTRILCKSFFSNDK